MHTALTSPAPQPGFLQLFRADSAALRDELRSGLARVPATVSPKFLYDALGSRLFEAITELAEYYPTRTEAAILQQHLPEIATAIGTGGTLIDLGAGNCRKGAALFAALRPERYVAVDIATEFVRDALTPLQREHPHIAMSGVGLDFAQSLDLPPDLMPGRPVFFYAGSSIGNFTPGEALAFLSTLRERARGGGVLIGVDLVKPTAMLEAAYDDALGVTAAFNLNLLLHLNRLLGSDFAPHDWRHVARFDATHSRIEMHLEARRALTVRWPDGARGFDAGERMHTENSYKYTTEGFAALLRNAGFSHARHWTDPRGWFAVYWAEPMKR